MNDKVFTVTLAALLHDIGKLYQRAAKGDKQTLSSDARGMTSQVGRGQNSYAHCLWTVDFIGRHWRVLAPFVKNRGEFEALASCHHNPRSDDPAQQIVALADRASAGMDRDPADESAKGIGYYRRPLDSVFSGLNVPEQTHSPKPVVHHLDDLHGGRLFPVPKPELDTVQDEYGGLAESFDTMFGRLKAGSPDTFLENVASLITRYLWCVPSSTIDACADIPLGDHLLTSAAVASALAAAKYCDQAEPGTVGLRLVSGDVTGIQNFIFGLTGETNRQLAKLLRGRSFTVRMLTRLGVRMLTDAAGVSSLCALSVAGGRFSVLLPDTESSRRALAEVRSRIDRWLHARFFGELQFVIDEGVPFARDELARGRFAEVNSRAVASILQARSRVFADVLCSPETWVDAQRYEQLKEHRACPICGKEPAGGTAADRTAGPNCRGFIQLGRDLANGRYVSVTHAPGDNALLGEYKVEVHSSNPRAERGETMYRINLHESDDESPLPEIHYASFKPRRERVEQEESEPGGRTFEDLAAAAAERGALEALAVLKMDVDNMGYVSAVGFGERASISRYVAFSRMLNWFFAGYLPRLLKRDFPDTYTLFAGGDDLCLIGPWDDMIRLAPVLRAEFRRFVGGNPSLTISGGIELFKPRSPVVRAVERAEHRLEHAKSAGRDRVCVQGRALRWDSEFESQMEFARAWVDYVNKQNSQGAESSHNAMLYRFLEYHREHEEARKAGNPLRALRHRFRFIYDISRNVPVEWRTMPPFRELQASQVQGAIEETPIFKNLPIGITMAVYQTRNLTRKGGRE